MVLTSLNLLLINLWTRQVFPTLESPIRTTLQSWRASESLWRTLPILIISTMSSSRNTIWTYAILSNFLILKLVWIFWNEIYYTNFKHGLHSQQDTVQDWLLTTYYIINKIKREPVTGLTRTQRYSSSFRIESSQPNCTCWSMP